MADCVKRLLTVNYVATSVKTGSKGYLIDLGNEESRWMQGGEWRDKGCQPNQEGSAFSTDSRDWIWEKGLREFFRQGWCPSESIELDQPITTEEAKLQCELQAFNPTRKNINTLAFGKSKKHLFSF